MARVHGFGHKSGTRKKKNTFLFMVRFRRRMPTSMEYVYSVIYLYINLRRSRDRSRLFVRVGVRVGVGYSVDLE